MSLTDEVHYKITEAFIDDNSNDIILERRERIQTTAGGFKWQKVADLAPQKGRIVVSAQRGDAVSRTLPDGNILDISATLIFLPGADVQRGDLFLYDGERWAVGRVARVPDWRVSCEVGYA